MSFSISRSVYLFLGSALVALGPSLSTTGCSASKGNSGLDSAAIAQAVTDSLAKLEQLEAIDLRDSARVVIASLLRNPKTAIFDSLVVVQPPKVNNRYPMPVACGKVRGRPGIGGRSGATAFVFQCRLTVFVEEASNRATFAELWGRTCGNPQSRVILR